MDIRLFEILVRHFGDSSINLIMKYKVQLVFCMMIQEKVKEV